MNRCLPRFKTSFAALCTATACLSSAGLAWGQQMGMRSFPAQAQRGMLSVTAPPEVRINGNAQRLAPGIRIYGPTNMLVMSSALVGHTVPVNYLVEPSGMVRQVWILNEAEMAEQRGTWDTITNFVFESSGEQPKKDDGKTPFDQLPKYPKQ